jgi:pyruvate dehydrogenase E2 component (dihydrolipoamide acetyltransferase)
MAEHVFALPDLGEGLEEGTIAAWLVAEGDVVELNQPIAEIETAKAVVEMPSPVSGRIVALHVAEGSEARVGEALVTFEVAGLVVGAGPPAAGPGRGAATGDATDASGGAPSPAALRSDTVARTVAGRVSTVAATPAVRRLAKDLGVDLGSVTASGADGRVTREDVERAAGGARAGAGEVEEISVSATRRAIAARLVEIAAVPQVTTFRTVDCTALDAVRRELAVSPLPIVVRALAEIRADHPMLNASWGEDRILVHRLVNVGVATDTERGLVVPVVKDVGSRGVGAISDEVKRLADAARGGSLKAEDVSGATIAVSNTGSYGSEAGTPLLNPGHAVTLAFGMIEPRALVVDGRVEARLAATISLTFDHRVLDGANVGRGLTALVDLLEDEARLRALPR